LLREFSFISATDYNRKSFLQQVNKIFHQSAHYPIITAFDYHQLLCLLCSDFPRALLVESIKVLEPEQPIKENDNNDADPMFYKYKLNTLQKAVATFFYYNGIFWILMIKIKEFMENVRTIFQEVCGTPNLNISEEVSAAKILLCFQNYFKRVTKSANHPIPTIEPILETLACAAGLGSLFSKRTVTLSEDIIPLINEKISYKQFSQFFMLNAAEINAIFTGNDHKGIMKTNDKLKDIIASYQ